MLRATAVGAILATTAGCATQTSSDYQRYVRADSRTTETGHLRQAWAVCRVEAGQPNPLMYVHPVVVVAAAASHPSKEATALDACMAKHGYVTAQ
jgi:hypothetical protein